MYVFSSSQLNIDHNVDLSKLPTYLTNTLLTARRSKKQISSADYSDSDEEVPTPKGEDFDMFADNEDMSTEQKGKKNKLRPLTEEERAAEVAATREYEEGNDGIKIEPFNMREEMEEGDFDESGTYIRKKDQNEMHDSWLRDVSREDIEKAAEAHRKREKLLQATLSSSTPDTALIAKLPTDSSSLLKILVGLLQPRESVSRGLSRLNKIIQENRKKSGLGKNKNKNRQRKKTQETDMDVDLNTEHKEGVAHTEENLKIEEAKKDVELITEIADRLVGEGDLDVYSQTYESIMSKLRRSKAVDVEWTPTHPSQTQSSTFVSNDGDTLSQAPGDSGLMKAGTNENNEDKTQKWRYKWLVNSIDNEGSAEEYGPYEYRNMKEWYNLGYFNQGILLQPLNAQGQPIGPWNKSLGEEFK
ncbi:hypothetical protein BKA69DRAFT_1094252 [Paraphysoderma sedebokerense]|nr:hypothetical protein BKA69DRAFT_1094252 [Paraphysoderma sedebokerense]